MTKKIKHNKKPSPQAIFELGGRNKVEIMSKTTLDKHDCECKRQEQMLMLQTQGLNDKQRRNFMKTYPPIECPLIKKNKLKKYALRCPNCNDVVAYVHAKNKQLTNKANLHYYSWYDQNSWRGTYGVNINPNTLRTTFECCCGETSDLYQLKITTK